MRNASENSHAHLPHYSLPLQSCPSLWTKEVELSPSTLQGPRKAHHSRLASRLHTETNYLLEG